ncbi:MAG: hypothetical protein R8M14_02235 [Ghiorsea sp.]
MKAINQTCTIKLQDITGLHHRALELNAANTQPPYLPFGADDFSEDTVNTILTIRPIIVRKSREGFVCIGNSQSFILARMCLPQNADIPANLSKRKSLQEIEQLFWAEHLLLPIISDLGPKKELRVSTVWEAFRNTDSPWRTLPLHSLTTMQKLKALLNRK